MKKLFRTILPILIAIISMLYAIGDYAQWWDEISGRKMAMSGFVRLSSPQGPPMIIIFNDESEYKDLFSLIISRSENHKIADLYKKGELPSAIVRLGGTLTPYIGDELPEGYPNPKFVPDSSPILCLYNYTRDSLLSLKSIHISNNQPAGNLGEIRQWINDSRNRERFIISTILIGLLSLVVLFLDITRSKK